MKIIFFHLHRGSLSSSQCIKVYAKKNCELQNSGPAGSVTRLKKLPDSAKYSKIDVSLEIEEKGKACTKQGGVYLRVNPSKESEKISLLKPETLFTVLDNSENAGNYWCWWKEKLEYGKTGWQAKGGTIMIYTSFVQAFSNQNCCK